MVHIRFRCTLQSLSPWGFSVLLPDPQVGKSVVGPRTFATMQDLLWYNCSPVYALPAGQLYGGTNGDILQEGLCHTLDSQVCCSQSPCCQRRSLLTQPPQGLGASLTKVKGWQAPLSMECFRQEHWSGFHFLLQGIFPAQELNSDLLNFRRILYQVSYKGSPLLLISTSFTLYAPFSVFIFPFSFCFTVSS